ncbi:MAG: potassium transporter Kup [Alphaproteobacteria bacterium]|nr:potassium transporter Kup [Alphaproteobacteria bacterium]
MQKSPNNKTQKTLALALGSVGVVYGDIGTSPLYAFRESLHAATGGLGHPTADMTLGVLSLILWALVVIVTLKYVILLLRADNHGEGGILSLMALSQGFMGRGHVGLLTLGIAGAALFYGDAIITPAISVLSAVEGLSLVTHTLTPYIIPIAISIIVLLFFAQSKGTHKVAKFFGPIMTLWFVALGWGGLLHAGDNADVWKAISPLYAYNFMMHHGMAGFVALGAVFLSVTGAEALYADLGHFGKKPIRLAWFALVMPCLMLNYFGQAALVLSNPAAAEKVFFLLYPDWALLPMVLLSTVATVIASQAVITGAFSLTHQAVQLGLLPRVHVKHTSEDQQGQIYIPKVNWPLLIGVLLLIFIFHTSSNLAAAYGIAVTGTMVITAILTFQVMRHLWKWPTLLAGAVMLPLLLIELIFLTANMTKFFDGGFLPLIIALALIVMMRTWVRGSHTLHEQARDPHDTIAELINELNHYPPTRVSGTAVYLSSNADYAPTALLHNLKHNQVLHDHNILLTLRFLNAPYAPDETRVEMHEINHDLTRVTAYFGYMESPNVLKVLRMLREKGLKLDMMNTTFFISRRNVVTSPAYGMPLWQDRIFIAMTRFASDAANYFHLPQSRVFELGVQVTV